MPGPGGGGHGGGGHRGGGGPGMGGRPGGHMGGPGMGGRPGGHMGGPGMGGRPGGHMGGPGMGGPMPPPRRYRGWGYGNHRRPYGYNRGCCGCLGPMVMGIAAVVLAIAMLIF